MFPSSPRWSFVRFGAAAALGAALIALVVCPASADTVLVVGNGDRVSGSVFPTDGDVRFIVTLPANAKITVKVRSIKVKKIEGPPLSTTFFDPEFGTLSDLSGAVAASATVTRRGTASVSGTHRLDVSSAVAGDFEASIRWKSPKSVKNPVVALGATPVEESFGADQGARAKFDVRAAAGSAARPRLIAVRDSANWEHTFPMPSNSDATRHSVKGVVLGGIGGAYRVEIQNVGGDGDVSFSVALIPPKLRARKVNVTTDATGADPLNAFTRGGIAGPVGGLILGGGPGEGPIEGSAVLLPPDALSKPTAIAISTARAIVASASPGPSAGPAVSFTPEGLTFSRDTLATLTIPFDPTQFPLGDFSALQVYVRDAKGVVTLVDPVQFPYTIDAANGTVSFPTAHFSSYQVFGPARQPPADLNGDGFDDLVIPAPLADNTTGKVYVLYGRANLGPNSTSTFNLANADQVFSGGAIGEYFGAAVAVADVNGDGQADLLVGAPSAAAEKGIVRVYFGGANFGLAAATSTLTGGNAFDHFGSAIATGDIDANGVLDVVVGAPSAGGANGALYVFFGDSGFATRDVNAADVITMTGSTADFLGAVIAVGDLNSDGHDDIATSASSEQISDGKVYLISGVGLVSGTASSTAFATYVGSSTEEDLGRAMVIADFDADGMDDLVIGAPLADVVDEVDAGVAYLAFQKNGFPGGSAASSALRIGEGSLSRRFGAALRATSVIGNAAPDLLIGAPDSDAAGQQGGRIFLARGGSDFLSGFQVISATGVTDRFGAAFLPPADLNGDGRREIIFAAPDANSGRGVVTILFNGLFSAPALDVIGFPEDHLGSSLEPLGSGL